MSLKESGLTVDEYFSGKDIVAPVAMERPKLGVKITAESAKDFAEKMVKYEAHQEGYTSAHDAHRKALMERESEFHDYFFECMGVTQDHPKAGKLYSLAWERGHSSGYSEVLNYGYDFVELMTVNEHEN